MSSSSSAEVESLDEKHPHKTSHDEDSYLSMKEPDEMDIGGLGEDVERIELLPPATPAEPAPAPHSTTRSSIIWMIVNTLATIGIVFTNKAIFSDPTLKLAQLTFAAFHFFMTWLTLFTLSRPKFGMFVPKRVAVKQIIPLAIAMSLNVILPNLSLAFSTVTFYQVARILLTPTVALMNFVLYKSTLPRGAILALIPACLGVGMVAYYDSKPSADASIKTTSSLGVIFAMSGIFASSLYTVWISSYHKKLQMNSMQLLFNQAPLAAFMLLYVIPFVDTFPTWTEVPINRWGMIMMSGFFACVINMSQFFIIAQTGPVSSTVVGHGKTCSIVALGWITSGRAVGDKSIIGVLVAVGGIITYSIVMLKHKAAGGK
ncbi:triose-phosphate transporter family-domain-containing protein [Calycina marina]|uniref:GDP-mannose transporter n=1 Tax=Calycina marina TaxID=1763456 RepID=A0A9P8CGE1_9HELO|nr:triose-phosphate transporter family-domain-containing protein [Calycina marina]